MARFCLFIDGSNLFGSLSSMDLPIEDYQAFYLWLFKMVRNDFGITRAKDAEESDALTRAYWYVVGTMDEWDLDDAKAQATLRDVFERDKGASAPFLATAGRKLAEATNTPPPQDEVKREAWAQAFGQMRRWYESRKSTLAGIKRFHHAVRASTDFIDVLECGHWKVDFIRQALVEKGLDAALSVDMVALVNNYDVAIVVSGDADMLPSIRHVKARGKHVGIVEFVPRVPADRPRSRHVIATSP